MLSIIPAFSSTNFLTMETTPREVLPHRHPCIADACEQFAFNQLLSGGYWSASSVSVQVFWTLDVSITLTDNGAYQGVAGSGLQEMKCLEMKPVRPGRLLHLTFNHQQPLGNLQ